MKKTVPIYDRVYSKRSSPGPPKADWGKWTGCLESSRAYLYWRYLSSWYITHRQKAKGLKWKHAKILNKDIRVTSLHNQVWFPHPRLSSGSADSLSVRDFAPKYRTTLRSSPGFVVGGKSSLCSPNCSFSQVGRDFSVVAIGTDMGKPCAEPSKLEQ